MHVTDNIFSWDFETLGWTGSCIGSGEKLTVFPESVERYANCMLVARHTDDWTLPLQICSFESGR